MPALKKFCISAIYCALFLIFFFFIFTSLVFASDSVVINEFMVHPSSGSDWIELYNKSGTTVDIGGWFIEDTTGTVKTFAAGISIDGYDFYHFTVGNRLNNGGDVVTLKNDSGEVVDSKEYTSDPGVDISLGRSPDGSGTWISFSSPTPGSSDNGSATPSPSPSPTPTPTPTPSTATYKINEVKDEDGNVLTSVKVYLDGIYLHHYVPETLTFCHSCQCDTYIDCGFGEHTIKLEKSGFGNWSETKTINAGDSYEVNPVMISPDSTPTPTPTPSSTPSPRAVELETTLGGEILGGESSPGGIYLLESPSPSPEVLGEKTSKSQILAKIFLVVGSIFLFGAGFSLWYNFVRNYRGKRSPAKRGEVPKYTQLRVSKTEGQNGKENKIIN